MGGEDTDVSPFDDRYVGLTQNETIDMYAYTVIEPCPERNRVRLVTADGQQTWEGEASPQLALDGRLNLHKGVYNRIVRDFNSGRPLPLVMTTHTESPPCSGHDSPTTHVVSMIK